jgi:hypothetical protein
MSFSGPLPLPSWCRKEFVANPRFHPNPEMIQAEAEALKKKFGVPNPRGSELRVMVARVDTLPDFTYPLTSIDPITGQVTRHIPESYANTIEIPEWWRDYTTGNQVNIYTELDVNNLASVAGGRLSVPGAWSDTWRGVVWEMVNAAYITLLVNIMDAHSITARYDMHFYEATAQNPRVKSGQLKEGDHPYGFMDGPGKPFPVITPENLWHPRHNPAGHWRPVIDTRQNLDETWFIVNKLGHIVLWFKHGHRFTSGAILDPMYMASTYHHAFLRGGITSEPVWLSKGVSWRGEQFGGFQYEVQLDNDPDAQPLPSMSAMMKGGNGKEPIDIGVLEGQALTHCIITTAEQAVADLESNGMSDRVRDLVLLTDTCSSIPGFEEQARVRLKVLAKKGLRIETTETFNLYDL